MTARHTHLQSVLQVGNDLISDGNFGAEKIQERIDEINEQWESLIDLAAFRKKRLNEAVDFYQVTTYFVAFICSLMTPDSPVVASVLVSGFNIS